MRHIFLLLCMLGKFLSDLRHYKFHLVGTVCIFVSINILELCPGMCFHYLKSVWSVQILLLGFFEWFHSHIEWGVHFPNSGGKILWSALPCVLYSVVSPLRLVGTGTIPGPSVNDSDALMTWPEHVLTHVLWSMFIWLGRPPSGSEVLSASFPVPSAAWLPGFLVPYPQHRVIHLAPSRARAWPPLEVAGVTEVSLCSFFVSGTTSSIARCPGSRKWTFPTRCAAL